MEKNLLKIKTNLVAMPKGVFVLLLVGAFLFGDAQACYRVNKKTLKAVIHKEEAEDDLGADEE